MVYHLHSDAAGGGFVEGPGGVAVERGPSLLVDLGLEGCFECFVGIVCPQEICVTNEEAFLVIIGVYKPTGNAFGSITADFSSIRVENINAMDGNLDEVTSG